MNLQRKLAPGASRVIAVLMIAAFTVALTGCATVDTGLQKLSGSWNVAVVSKLQGPFPGLLTFTADGGLIGDPPPIGTESTSHGNWLRTSPTAAEYTFVALITNDKRVVTANLKVVGTLDYDAASDSWSGPYKLTISALDGSVLASDGGTFRLTRVAVEKLS
jgi:hypothetical protein